MADTERLSPGALLGLIDQLEQGIATPDDAREFLTEFVACVAAGEQVRVETLRCLQKLFAGYLDKTYNTLDAAFLMTQRGPGNPGADQARERDIALEILSARVKNPKLLHSEAVAIACEKYACENTKAGTAWRHKRTDALGIFLLTPHFYGDKLTDEEKARAKRIAIPKWAQPKTPTARK